MPEGIIQEIEQILYSGNLAFGHYGRLFEESLKDYIGNELTFTASSYNQAMLVILSTLDLAPGDEVIASPVSCLASNQPFAVKNLNIVWADINPKTGTLDPENVKTKISSRTKAIFHNHYCGYVGEIEEINNIGKQHGLVVIDDAIEAFGSEFKKQKMGNIDSDITIFSFQPVRLPNTIEGAAISFSNKSLFEKASLIRDYGIDRTKFRDSMGEINSNCDIKLEGYGSLMNEVNSFIGDQQMKVIDDLLKKQRLNASIWDNKINDYSGIQCLTLNKNSIPNYWVYGLLCENKQQALLEFRRGGLYATGVHINNNIYSVFKNSEKLKGVDEFMQKYLAVPCGWWVNL